MQFRKHVALLAVAGVTCGVLAACSSNSKSGGSSSSGTRVNGGTATIALSPGNNFDYIFPLLDYTDATEANIEYSEYLMWRPLYWFGGPNSVGVNDAESLAAPAQITASGSNTVATIQLKSYRWSDGAPVTARDIQFWLNLMKVNPTNNWWGYVPGQLPDNVLNFKTISPTKFAITFKGHYSDAWLYNQLGQLIPIPQQAWDKKSASGKVGNYDETPSGAKAVLSYLKSQNKATSTYATNPLWQVVDGPWKITSYAGTTTGNATYVRNMKFSGPATGSLHELKVISYTSDTAEFDSLLSAGGITYGYVPYNDAAEISRVESDGYAVQAWPSWGITYITLNFGSPQVGAIFKQLYIRQAMQHLINQAGYISSFLSNYGNPTYGPVPLVPKSKFVSPQQAQNPYPYNPAEAISLLKAHGWKVTPGGVSTCSKPGSGPADCGTGIAAGAKLTFNLEYATGTQAGTEEDAALKSAFAQAGIQVQENGTSFDNAIDDDIPCTKSNCWQMNYYDQGWFFDPGYNDPDGTVLFKTGAVDNSGLYNDPTANSLMDKLPSGGYPALYNYENYLSKQLPMLWMPQFDAQISAVSSKLKGAFPQDPENNIYPEDWYYVK